MSDDTSERPGAHRLGVGHLQPRDQPADDRIPAGVKLRPLSSRGNTDEFVQRITKVLMTSSTT